MAILTTKTEDTSPTSDDILYSVNDPSGTPADRKVTAGNLITKAHGLSDGYPKVASGVMTTQDAMALKTDLSLDNVDNTSDLSKPVSTAQQTALDAKVDTTTTVNGHALSANITVSGADLGMSDVTTNNVSTTKHGFAPKAPNDATKFLDGTGAWSAPASGGGIDTSRIWRCYTYETAADTAYSFYTKDKVGSGDCGVTTGQAYLDTGTTANSHAWIQIRNQTMTSTGGTPFYNKNSEFTHSLYISSISTGSGNTTKTYFFMGWSDGTLAATKYGFRLETNDTTRTLYAWNADGTNQTSTDISSGITLTDGASHTFRAVYTAGSNIKFYVDGVLKATHTTNLPSGVGTANSVLFSIETYNDTTTAEAITRHGPTSIVYDY